MGGFCGLTVVQGLNVANPDGLSINLTSYQDILYPDFRWHVHRDGTSSRFSSFTPGFS